MWDDDDIEEDVDLAELWVLCVDLLSLELQMAYGWRDLSDRDEPVCTEAGAVYPRLSDDEVRTIRVAQGQVHVIRLHDAFICWELTQAR